MSLRLIDYECFYGRAKYKEALGLWLDLEEKSYFEAPLFINLAYYYLFEGGDFEKGETYFRLVSAKVQAQRLEIKDMEYFFLYQKCSQ